ncbi:hypothetical protein [Phytoactinopolyspora halophila]|uniref:hypothetical protein n=1 Tax=Phytoactinopolyspora halophila TaxID=1981511 RepID=UPI000F4FE9C5|nr:hypothetical protein [Phytoactinopolyspora halophila]
MLDRDSLTIRWFLSSVIIWLLVSGCAGENDDGAPGTLPDATPTEPSDETTPTDDPTSEQTLGGDSTETIEQEITEFFKEYIETSDKSWESSKALDRRRDMFADSCDICLAGYELAAESVEDDLSFVGDPGKIVNISLTNFDGELASVLIQIDAPAAQLIDSEGNLVREFQANIGSQIVYQVQRASGEQWIIIKGDVLQ